LLVAMVLSTVAVGLWLAFGVGVWLWLRETTGSVSVLSVCFLVGLVSFVTLLLAGFTVVFSDSRLPAWSAWIAVVAALAHIVLLASLVIPSGFFSLQGGVIIAIPAMLFAWITGTSIAMMTADR
jgi:hypothetical protein